MSRPGTIPLVFYIPKSFKTSRLSRGNDFVNQKINETRKYPLVLNFHGGGFTIGGPRMDARWAGAIVDNSQQEAIVVSVGYRRAPEYPYPIAIEDGLDALFWMYEHADEYDIDRSRIVFSGFSAGANVALIAALRLHVYLEEQKALSLNRHINLSQPADPLIKLAGIVAFYPTPDRSTTRAQKIASNPISEEKTTISAGLYDLFDQSYHYPPTLDKSSPCISIKYASTEILSAALPDSIALFTCEWDEVRVDGEEFRNRLEEMGKDVSGWMVKGVAHGWDKRPSFKNGDKLRDEAYAEAVKRLHSMCE